PATKYWLARMMGGFSAEKQIVLGYSPYQPLPGFLNVLIQYETFYTALQYASLAFAKMPYMGVGRNLAYTKTMFKSSLNFHKTDNPLSGDDDLLVNEMANQHNTALVLHPDAQIYSVPKRTWKEWMQQKTRHYSAGIHYRFKHQLFLRLFNFSSLIFSLFLFALLFSKFIFMALALFAIRCIVMLYVAVSCKWFFPNKFPPLFNFITDFMVSLFLFTLGTLSLFKQTIWKN